MVRDKLRSKSRPVIFRMTQPQYNALSEAAKAEGVTVSELVRAVVIERTHASLLAENQRLRAEVERLLDGGNKT